MAFHQGLSKPIRLEGKDCSLHRRLFGSPGSLWEYLLCLLGGVLLFLRLLTLFSLFLKREVFCSRVDWKKAFWGGVEDQRSFSALLGW